MSRKAGLKRLCLAILALYFVALAAIWWQQRALVFLPQAEQVSPAAAGFGEAQSLSLNTPDGETLVAWFRPPAADKPLIVYFHGNANHLGADGRRLAALAEDGFGLFALDYRGYGGSTGLPSEARLLTDAETAMAKVAALGIAPEKTVVYGHSLGSAVAVAMAARHTIAALVLEAPFSSAVDVAQARYWMFPARWLMQDTFRSDKRIGSVHVPLLILHGSDDGIIPIAFGRRLFALANQPKQFIELAEAGHMLLLRQGVAAQIHQWIATTLLNISVKSR